LRERLRQSGIRYLDASGNCYIRAGHSVLFVDERKVSRQRRSGLSGLWKPTGLRFLFTVLVKPEVLQADYRMIAVACRLSLGTVAGLMQELERSPYFKKVKGVWQVNDRESLLARWLDHYHSHLATTASGALSFCARALAQALGATRRVRCILER
jgi:hypothetical protein